MLVFGDVGEMREIAIGAHDRSVWSPSRLSSVASSSRRAPASLSRWKRMEALRMLLDQLEHLFALLLAHGVAEDPAEEADVVAKRQILVGLIRGRRR